MSCSRPSAAGRTSRPNRLAGGLDRLVDLGDEVQTEGVQFIPLVDATISTRNGERPVERPFIAVARDHVQLAYEAD